MLTTIQEPRRFNSTTFTLRTYLKAVQHAISERLYKDLSGLTETQVEQLLAVHSEYLFTHPGLKQNMRLVGIAIGGDANDLMLEFTDTTMAIENWNYAMKDMDMHELITLIESIDVVVVG